MKIKQSRLKSSLISLLILVLLLGFYQLWPYLVFEKIQTDSVQQIFLYNHQIPLQDSWSTLIEVKDCAARAFLLEQAGQIQLVKRAHDRGIPFGFFPRIHLQSKTWHQTITFFSEPEGPMIMVYTEKYNSSGQRIHASLNYGKLALKSTEALIDFIQAYPLDNLVTP